MTIDRETVIKLARESGFPIAWISETGVLQWSELERFAALVLEHGRKPLTDDACMAEFRTQCIRNREAGRPRDPGFFNGVRFAEIHHGITNKESSDAE